MRIDGNAPTAGSVFGGAGSCHGCAHVHGSGGDDCVLMIIFSLNYVLIALVNATYCSLYLWFHGFLLIELLYLLTDYLYCSLFLVQQLLLI